MAASTCSGAAARSSASVSSVAGFSTASGAPGALGLLAADQQSRLHARRLYEQRAQGAAAMAFFTVSGLVKIWSGVAS